MPEENQVEPETVTESTPEAAPEVAPEVVPEVPPVAFQLEVEYKPETTQEERDATIGWVKECTDALAGDDVTVPACVAAFTVRRVV